MPNDPTPENLSTIEFFQRFPNEESARLHLEAQRWDGEPVCGHCGSRDVSECKDHKPMPYRCKSCRKHFSVRTGTVLAESRIPLQKWLLAICLMTNSLKSIPLVQMAQELGITRKSAWFLAQRIRESWLNNREGDSGPHTAVDKTDVGGRERNKHSKRRLRAGHDAVEMTAVFDIRDRSGEARVEPMPNTKTDSFTDMCVKHFVWKYVKDLPTLMALRVFGHFRSGAITASATT